MPGICGFYDTRPRSDSADLAAQMLTKLRVPGCRIASQRVDPAGRFALGRASIGVLPTAPQPVSAREGKLLAVVDGELYDMDKHCSALQLEGYRLHHDDDATALLTHYATGGIDSIARLEGSFAAAIVDVEAQTLALISDRFATRPIYYAHTGGRLTFGSNIASLLADPEIPRAFDWQGLSQFFTFGHYFNNNTSLGAVKILPAGARLVFHAKDGRITIHRYWHGSDRIAARPKSRQQAYEAVDESLFASVRKRQLAGGVKIGLSLSGGLDARTILGTLDHRRNNMTSVCMGMEGSRDHAMATELARIVGCNHYNHTLDTKFLADFGQHLEGMARLTDGQYLSQCIVMPTLSVYRRLGIGVLLRGHAGELMHMSKAYNYSLDSAASRLETDADLESWLWPRLKAYIHDGIAGPLFAQRGLSETEAARESLRTALADTPPGEPPASRICHLFLDQRVRRETMLSLMKFRSVTEPRLPYLDRALVEQLLAMPIEWRMGDELQTHILRKRQPAFCIVENTNNGAPLGAGPLRREYARFKLRVFSKLGMPGYQPYERLGLWLRRELAPLVRETLLNDRCLDRGVFDPNTVRAAVERHLAGQRNHTYLIMALMIFEVGHRQLLEDESFGIARGDLQLAAAN